MNCPICKKPIAWEDNPVRPFCSARCRLLDLEGWLHERYRVPVDGENLEPDESGDIADSP